MAEVGRIRSRFELEIAGFQRSMQRMQRSLERTQRELRETGREGTQAFRRVDTAAAGLVGTFRSVARASVVLGSALGAMQLGRFAVQLESVSSTLRFLTGNQENAAGVFARVSRLANELGANVLDLTESYVQLTGATRGADFSQAEIESLFRALTISARALGRSNADLRLAFRGLAQGLGSANVQYQEILQVTEALPGTLNIMAGALNKTTGEFKQFISTGRATPREVFLPFARAANEQFLPALQEIERRTTTAFNRMINAIINFTNAVVRTGALDLAAAAINRVAQGINLLTTFAQNAIRALTNLTRRLRGLPPIPRVVIDIPGPSTQRPPRRGFPAVSGSAQNAQVEAFRANQAAIAQENFQLQLIFDQSRAAILRNNAEIARSFQTTASIITTTFQTIGSTFAQLTIGVLRGTQTMSEALRSLAESLATSFLNQGIQALLGVGQAALLGALVPGVPSTGPATGAASGSGAIFGGPGGLLGRGISIINVPDAGAASGVAAQEAAQGRSVITNTVQAEFARGNSSALVRTLRQTLGR